jgi:hypothetical protein
VANAGKVKVEIQMATATALKPSVPKQLPPPNSDFYQLADVLTVEEKAIVKKVRTYMETTAAQVRAVANKVDANVHTRK